MKEDQRHRIRRRRDRVESYIQRGALAVLIVLYFVGFKTISNQANDAEQQAKEIAAVQQNTDDSRVRVVKLVCKVDNTQNAALRALIIKGAQSSKPFEALYRQYGLPPYNVRLRQAREAAATLGPLQCKELVSSVAKSTKKGR